MDFEFYYKLLVSWLHGEPLTHYESKLLILFSVLLLLIIITLALFIYMSVTTLFWTRIGWFFEDIWHWIKTRRIVRRLLDPQHFPLVSGSWTADEDLTDEEVQELQELINQTAEPLEKE